jgi:cytochrome c peroxidase
MKSHNAIYFVLCCSLFLFNACLKTNKEADVLSPPQLPEQVYSYNAYNFPITVSETDKFTSIENEVATLGRVLFYDPKLSATNRVSCASCHLQSAAFSDVSRFSSGFTNEQTPRNAMAIMNSAFHNGNFFWDLRAESLNDLVSQPIENHIEMGMEDMEVLSQKLASIDYYPLLFEKAFGDKHIDPDRISEAITQFMNAMVSFDSKYDQNANNDFANFSELEKLGKTIFFEKGKCVSCHDAPTFSPSWGLAATNIGLDMEYEDQGVGTLEMEIEDFEGNIIASTFEFGSGSFKIPTLRNIQLTAPYMHDGRFSSLEEVVEHYNSGIQNHPNLDWRLRDFIPGPVTGVFHPQRLNLNAQEKQALVAFLKTLSDETFIKDVKFSNPFSF